MKRRTLLSLIIMMMAVIGAKADEPIYTAVGTVSAEASEGYTPIVSGGLTDVKVEVYTNSVVIRNYTGVEGYDLTAQLDADGHVTELYESKNGIYSYEQYRYIYTGLTAPYCVAIYLGAYEGAYYAFGNLGDATTKTGYLSLYGTAYGGSGSYGSYEISWAPSTTGITTVEAAPAAKNDAIYNLAGQRVNANAKGIVIKNGKKYLVK